MALVLAAAPSAQAELLSTFEATSASTQAGAYADVRTNFVVADIANPVDKLRFHLPVGLLGSIGRFAECPLPTFYGVSGCPMDTQVGEATSLVDFGGPGFPLLIPLPSTVNVLTRGRGDAALLGIYIPFVRARALIRVNVRPDDYGLDATVEGLPNNLGGTDLTLWGVPWDHWDDSTKAKNERLSFMANPATCGTEAVTKGDVNSYKNRDVIESFSATTPAQTGCEALRFEPTISVRADNPFVSAPSSFEFGIDLPQNTDPNGLETPPIRNVTAVLPEGLTINAALANGLEACTDAQLGKGSNEQSRCPAGSRIGTAEFEVPALKDPHVAGAVYVGEPLPDDTYRLFVEAYGSSVRVKLKGSARPDPKTGRLTAVFENNPEAPASSIKLAFKGGSRAPLAMPDTCGLKPVSATIDAWSGHTVSPTTAFEVGQDAKGSPCAAKPFAPSFSAGVLNPLAGASSTFTVQAYKPDGQPDLTGVSLTLPPGLVANLKGNIGQRVGTARVAAGVGPSPFSLSGPVVLEGAYGDAPFSLRVTVPVIAGPFNLGDVVVLQKIYVDPVDTHVTVVSDPLPTIVKGVPVRLQNLQVDIDKSGFMKNPTSCASREIKGTLSSATGQAAPAVSRFQAAECTGLGYTPQLAMTLSGKGQTKDGAHPALTAHLTPPAGDANSKKVTVTLPLALALDPGNANGLCEPADAAKNQCAASTIVGSAEAQSILPDALKAPVYFVRGERIDSNGKVRKTLPKLFMPLTANGVTVNVWASSDVEDDRLVTTFDNLPDAPFSSFDLNINGGDHGILAVSNTNLCAGTQVADARYGGQNGKPYTSKVTMGTPCGVEVVKSSHTSTALKVTVGGLGAGRVSASGNGVVKSSRTLTSSTTATLTLKLTKATRRTLARGRDVKVKVKVAFTAKGQKKATTATKTVVLHGTKKR
ncbi:MAG TPA: hypothetical protein VFY45_08605 [Baekduia sp.]|nr:hypothetical protein [Baekduia sp.]